MVVVAVVAVVVLLIKHGESISLKDTAIEMVAYYDKTRPPRHNHARRCQLQSPESARMFYADNRFSHELHENPAVYVNTPCLGSDSLGNYLGGYFENVLCANQSRLHYMALAKVWQPEDFDHAPPFIATLPDLIPHPNPVTTHSDGVALMKQHCHCVDSCHEKPIALWHQHIPFVQHLLEQSLSRHIAEDNKQLFQRTIVNEHDKSNRDKGTLLPFLPEVAIHYRCGDNFVGHYGFLPFVAFKKLIPPSVTSIYVLSETRGRKTSNKKHMEHKCDVVLQSLFDYLIKEFPSAVVVLRRGDDMYADFARLAYAKMLICSVSTFCLWPAIMSNGTNVYFPKTKLIVGGETSIVFTPKFSWIESPAVIKGVFHAHSHEAKDLVNELNANT